MAVNTVGSSGLRQSGNTYGPPMYLGFSAIATTTALVAGIPGMQIVVISYGVTAGAGATVNLQSHVTTGVATGARVLAINSSFELPYSPVGHFATVVGEGLDIVTGAAVSGDLTFVYIAV